jgi:amino-acid N-acetyltransferase
MSWRTCPQAFFLPGIGPLPRCTAMSTVFNFTFVPWFRSVAPYIHKFRHQTFVVGLTGEAIAAGKLQPIVQDLAMIQAMGVKIVLVHGFRPQVNEQLRQGPGAALLHGMRVTDSVALDCAQEAAGQLRYEIEAAFSQGLPNTPMAGATVRVISGNFLTARPVGIVDGVDFSTPAWCARWTWRASARAGHRKPWCCCRPSASRPPARPST